MAFIHSEKKLRNKGKGPQRLVETTFYQKRKALETLCTHSVPACWNISYLRRCGPSDRMSFISSTMIQLHHEMHKTQICRCRYLNDIINTRYICYVIYIYNIYLIQKIACHHYSREHRKNKSIIIDGARSPPLQWHRGHFHSLY